MPDYNPAVAAGYQPQQPNLLGTLEGLSQLQIGQAHAGLYSLEALRQQRELNARQAGANALTNGQDPGLAYYQGGGQDPAYASGLQSYQANKTAIGLTGMNTTPQNANALEELNKNIRGNAAQLANQYIADPTSENWQAMRDYTAKHQGENAAKQLDSITTPEARMARATGHVGGGLSAEQGAADVKTETPQGAPQYQTRAQFLQSQTPQPGAPTAGGPTVGATPFVKSTQEETAKYFTDPDKMPKQYAAAQQVKQDMTSVMNSVDRLGPGWMGPGAEGRAHYIAAVNTAAQSLGIPPVFDEKVAQSQDLGKLAKRAGFALAASTFGASREASQTIQTSIGSVVNQGNTLAAAKIIGAGIVNDAQRKTDRMDYELANRNKMLPIEADREFDKKYPPEMYAKRAIAQSIDQAHLQALRDHPEASASFNKTYGDGMAQFVLSNPQFPQ